MKAGSKCGIVLDEGVLFRANEEAFVKTKEKLLEECDVHCIVSLPGGVFTSAGAGVKTNLVFFTKGPQTEKIWYYDLSDVKTGKKTPFTQAHFDNFFQLLPTRPESERSWTVDFSARQEKARNEARPYHEKAIEFAAQAKTLEEQLLAKRKIKTTPKDDFDVLELNWKTILKSARENLSKATDIENAVYDLKAVNPYRKVITDTRTPTELLDFIESKGREADAALLRLRELVSLPSGDKSAASTQS
jgi:type I restriction enzyme M protein